MTISALSIKRSQFMQQSAAHLASFATGGYAYDNKTARQLDSHKPLVISPIHFTMLTPNAI